MTTPTPSILTMPIPGTKLAPEKFKGEYNLVQRFIQHYERLCDQNNVTIGKEKCETITQYCSKKVGEFVEALDSYTTSNWNQLKDDLLSYYDSDRSSKRYRHKDIISYTEETKVKKIKDLSTWKRYTRGFVRIGGWLKSKGKISDEEHATYFWQGIPRTLRMRIENRLFAEDPKRSLAKAWPVADVTAAAEAILQRDRFDRNFIDSDQEERDETDSDGSLDEADSEDEDSETELKKLKKQTKKLKELAAAKRAKKKASIKVHFDSEDEDSRIKKSTPAKGNTGTTKSSEAREVEELVKQLNSMSLNDPDYGYLYFKAIKMDKDVEKVVKRPQIGNSQGNNGRASGPVGIGQRRDPPPHLAQQNPPTTEGYVPRPPMRCFGCGELGHGITRCHKVDEMLQDGTLAKDHGGRIINGDGTYIRRVTQDETLVAAIDRQRKEKMPQSNLVTISRSEPSFYLENLDPKEDERDVEGAWETELDSDGEIEHFVYPVETRKRGVAESSRKKVQDKVYPEPLPPGSAKGRDRMNQPPRSKDKSTAATENPSHRYNTRQGEKEFVPEELPIRPQVVRKIPSEPPVVSPAETTSKGKSKEVSIDPTPVEIRGMEWDPDNDRDVIEDSPNPEISNDRNRAPTPPLMEKASDRKKPTPRRSAVSAHVDPLAVLTRLLSTPVQLQVGEVLGVSKELSGLLNESIKLKSGKPMVASSFLTKTRGLLIKLQMECEGKPLVAIIDTGSQLNVVSKAAWKEAIRRPMDIAKTLAMNDANGGEGVLRGLVQHVPLSCGQVHTQANLYVGEHVPFQLLLGRPWQRGNFVSIDERMEGTYLVFKDPSSLEARYEVLVHQDNPDHSWNFDPTLWAVPAASENLLLTIPSRLEIDQSSDIGAELPNGKENSPMQKAWIAFTSITQQAAVMLILTLIAVLRLATQGMEILLGHARQMKISNEEIDLRERVEEFRNRIPSPIQFPLVSPPAGHIVNSFIRENRSPIVPSTISCSFSDRTDSEIIDRVRSEVPYHRRIGFNNQAIVGAHIATELKPTHEDGRLARRMVLNDAILITNADNSDPPNIMLGDIILKQYPKIPSTTQSIQFPVYKSPTIPKSNSGEPGNPEPLGLDRRVEVYSYFVNPDQESETPNMERNIGYTTTAGVPISEASGSPIYSPQETPDPPIPFPTLNLSPVTLSDQQTGESYSVDSDPEASSKHLATQARTLSGSIQYLKTRLDEVRIKMDKTKQAQHSPNNSCEDTHEYQGCSRKRSWDPEEEQFQRLSRRARRKERDRHRNEDRKNKRVRVSDKEDELNLERGTLVREGEAEMGRVINELRGETEQVGNATGHLRTVKKPFTSRAELDARLYSDDENSPIRVMPPSQPNTVFSTNPYMPNVTFHVTTPGPEITHPPTPEYMGPFRTPSETVSEPLGMLSATESIDTLEPPHLIRYIRDNLAEIARLALNNRAADSLARTEEIVPGPPSRSSTPASMPPLEEIPEYEEPEQAEAKYPPRVVYDAESDQYFYINEEGIVGSMVDGEAGNDIALFNPFPDAPQPPLDYSVSEPAYSGEDSMFYKWDAPVHRFYIRTILAPSVPEIGPRELSVPKTFDQGDPEMDIDFPKEAGEVTEQNSIRSIDIFGGTDSTVDPEDEQRADPAFRISDPSGKNLQMEEVYEEEEEIILAEQVARSATHVQFRRLQSAICKFMGSDSPWLDLSETKLLKHPDNPSSVILRNAILSMMEIIEYFPSERTRSPSKEPEHGAEGTPLIREGFQPPPYPSNVPRFCQHLPALRALQKLRRMINKIVKVVTDMLRSEDWDEMYHSDMIVLIEEGTGFREEEMNITEFFRQSGPSENTFFHEHENHFLRRAAYRFRSRGNRDAHDAIMDLLRVKVQEDKTVRLLLNAGYLEKSANDYAALHMLWVLEKFQEKY
jgi:hypothetical protein